MLLFVKYLYIFVFKVVLNRSITAPFMSGFLSYESSLLDAFSTVAQLH